MSNSGQKRVLQLVSKLVIIPFISQYLIIHQLVNRILKTALLPCKLRRGSTEAQFLVFALFRDLKPYPTEEQCL